ncbi:ankyrin repeat-containing domain protein [Aspergillus pseudodeflectus]|uniref:Ankyrin repeat-containing domain protein n=1 Tax=Aspergillus pseudodeflectus TaxID=176178 RepID=A0ABR4L6N2_9EURO
MVSSKVLFQSRLLTFTDKTEKWLLALDDSTLGSPLAHAARLGRTDIVKALMQHGAGVNDPSPANTKPPLAAAIDGACVPETLELLVESGAQVGLTLGIWNSLFSKLPDAHGAARPLIEKILSSAEVSEPIHDLLILVISDCMMQCRQQLIRSLIDKGADIHGVDSFGRTCLHWAALVGDVWTTGLLLGLGARQDVRDKVGNTALLLTYRGVSDDEDSDHNQAKIISLLLGHGADTSVENRLGHRCLDFVPSGAETCRRLLSEATTSAAD